MCHTQNPGAGRSEPGGGGGGLLTNDFAFGKPLDSEQRRESRGGEGTGLAGIWRWLLLPLDPVEHILSLSSSVYCQRNEEC